MEGTIALLLTLVILAGLFIHLISRKRKNLQAEQKLQQDFPEKWKEILTRDVLFYAQLDETGKELFEKRVQRFIATKKIEAIDTDVDDTVLLLVASSAVVPTYAFPDYNYPDVQTVLIYPNSFDEEFQTDRYAGHKEFITGMVGNRAMQGTVILSKPDLLSAFDGRPHKENVGIHEFVHLLDKEDGIIDGIPNALLEKRFAGPWLAEIKKELQHIREGKSDINPYALTNNAEFLAVVSEYFFDHPEKFKKRHPELYEFLSLIFNKKSTEDKH